MTGKRMGLSFVASLYLWIIIFHFFHDVWLIPWVPYLVWGLIAISLLLWSVTGLSHFRDFLAKRSVRFFVSLAFFMVGMLGILGVVNWYVASNNKSWDLTKNKVNSLSEQTTSILSKLEKKITLEVWTRSTEKMGQSIDVKRLLENYDIRGGDKLELVIKDPNTLPAEAKEKGINKDPIIIVSSEEGRVARVDSFNDARAEEQITNAIIQTLKGGKKIVCFTAGHSELLINQKSAEGLSFLRDALENSAYEGREITLLTYEKIPDYCELLVVPGPRTEPVEKEITLIKDFIKAGGPVIALLGLEVPQKWGSIVEDFGIQVNNDVVIDPRVRNAPLGLITQNFARDIPAFSGFNQPAFFRYVSSLKMPAAEASKSVKISSLVSAEEVTFARKGGLKALGDSMVERAGDAQGPFTIAALIEGAEKKAPDATAAEEKEPEAKDAPKERPVKVAVFGTFTFAANAMINNFSNKDLLLSTVNYMTGDTDLMGIRPKERSATRLELTRDNLLQVQGYIIFGASFFVFLALWSFRRRLSG